ncbi:hypothetical protein [Microbacterium sp. 10M-3C3]|jgi:hypothetical protein|uniref:hypothetical protein n=1 Tax=Microbacterium sp. 10M-3C3 TaxID=2483401 RepID=UPI000F63E046|nr:hypothetical protein [Microbacterium sp. 10M-3C3]
MNTTLSRARSLDQLAQPVHDEIHSSMPRISPIDRLSLRLGLWLLLRSTRSIRRIRPHDEHAHARRLELERQSRDLEAQRTRLLASALT